MRSRTTPTTTPTAKVIPRLTRRSGSAAGCNQRRIVTAIVCAYAYLFSYDKLGTTPTFFAPGEELCTHIILDNAHFGCFSNGLAPLLRLPHDAVQGGVFISRMSFPSTRTENFIFWTKLLSTKMKDTLSIVLSAYDFLFCFLSPVPSLVLGNHVDERPLISGGKHGFCWAPNPTRRLDEKQKLLHTLKMYCAFRGQQKSTCLWRMRMTIVTARACCYSKRG